MGAKFPLIVCDLKCQCTAFSSTGGRFVLPLRSENKQGDTIVSMGDYNLT